MSITRGPIVPPSTGSSTDFPVELSVNVIVPVTMLFPSIDPPLSLCPQAVAGFDQKNRLLARDWQTAHYANRPLYCTRRLGYVGDPAEAFRSPEHLHHPEDTGRSRRPGERGPQWLRHGAEPNPLSFREIPDLLFERAGFPNGVLERVQQLCKQLAGFSGKQLRRLIIQGDRPLCDKKEGVGHQFPQGLWAQLQFWHRQLQPGSISLGQRPTRCFIDSLGD